MKHWLLILRGESLEAAEPVAACTDLSIIARVTETLLRRIPGGEEVIRQARRKGIETAIEKLQEECRP